MPARSGCDRIGVLARVLLHGGMAGCGVRGGHLGGGAEVRARAVNMPRSDFPIRFDDGTILYLASWSLRHGGRAGVIVRSFPLHPAYHLSRTDRMLRFVASLSSILVLCLCHILV